MFLCFDQKWETCNFLFLVSIASLPSFVVLIRLESYMMFDALLELRVVHPSIFLIVL